MTESQDLVSQLIPRTVSRSQSRSRSYQYTPLTNQSSEIRVLRTLSSPEADEICCTVETVSLEHAPFYVALSYEWGEPEPEMEIKVDGKWMLIRHNLWLFLDHLRRTKAHLFHAEHFRIWVDAICIDQSNLVEKGTQVQLMGRIFTQADCVFAWLGWTGLPDLKNTVSFIKEAVFHMHSMSGEDESGMETGPVKYPPGPADTALFGIPASVQWERILHLLQLSYWSRRWIIQEILLAKDVTLAVDKEELSWGLLQKFFDLVKQYDGQKVGLSRISETVPWQMYKYRKRKYLDDQNPLGSLIALSDTFHASVCKVELDKVYSLLSLIPKGQRVRADYKHSMVGLFCQVLSSLLALAPSDHRPSLVLGLAKSLGVSMSADSQDADSSEIPPLIHWIVGEPRLTRVDYLHEPERWRTLMHAPTRESDASVDEPPQIRDVYMPDQTAKQLLSFFRRNPYMLVGRSHVQWQTRSSDSPLLDASAAPLITENQMSSNQAGHVDSEILVSVRKTTGRSFHCKDGTEGIVFGNARLRDILCHFSQDSAIVLRHEGMQVHIIGLAFIFSTSKSDKGKNFRDSSLEYLFDVPALLQICAFVQETKKISLKRNRKFRLPQPDEVLQTQLKDEDAQLIYELT